MKIIMPGLSIADWDGHLVGYAPGHVTEVPDDNPKAVAWARSWLARDDEYAATLVEDTPKAKEPPKPPDPKPVPPAPPEDTRTVEDLRVELKARGLPIYGTKQDLLDRLAKDS